MTKEKNTMHVEITAIQHYIKSRAPLDRYEIVLCFRISALSWQSFPNTELGVRCLLSSSNLLRSTSSGLMSL